MLRTRRRARNTSTPTLTVLYKTSLIRKNPERRHQREKSTSHGISSKLHIPTSLSHTYEIYVCSSNIWSRRLRKLALLQDAWDVCRQVDTSIYIRVVSYGPGPDSKPVCVACYYIVLCSLHDPGPTRIGEAPQRRLQRHQSYN